MIPGNRQVAEVLERLAVVTRRRRADPAEVAALQRAAETVRHALFPIADALRPSARPTAARIPGIPLFVEQYLREWLGNGQLKILRDPPEDRRAAREVLQSVAGIGRHLADEIHERLGVATLEELEAAAADGRLERLPGFGAERVRRIRTELTKMLGRHPPRAAASSAIFPGPPPVALLLDIDREYRHLAERGELDRRAPRRFNPTGEAWRPVWNTRRGGYALHASYSNSARAHRLGRSREWVLIVFERAGVGGQCTVVTEHRGPLKGRRVVRSREAESAAHDHPHPAARAEPGATGPHQLGLFDAVAAEQRPAGRSHLLH